ncbi:exodeoxyribonuclease V subunit gamma [Nocardioides kribbensis]|uniref:exodeoxyribonuclease V subunit gamma n=1 Tax=Nocardioides kribbensis TaxID=305517 RepID=UPI00187AE11D|nr:exodeoxyribonuclease V subunit gamma [Nocardioides kribbensis]
MALTLHRAPRADVLADGLAELLATPLADPFATEVVVVPARGVERWLSQRVSHRLGRAPGRDDGVCAGVDFRSPTSLVAEVTGTRDDDPWAPDTLVWPLLATLDASLDEPWARTLALHLGHTAPGQGDPPGEEGDLRRGRRFAVARRLARLLSSYAVQRPTLVADWSAGRDTDGAGRPLAPDLAWQPELWRRLVARVGSPPPQRHAQTVARLREDPAASDLPPRLSLFGHTRLPLTEVDLLAALGEHRDVHLWLPHPSAALWDALAAETAGGPVPRALDTSHRRVEHPLLSTLGRDTRELQRVLATVDLTDTPPAPSAPVLPTVLPTGSRPTLLGWLQEDLRANAVGPTGGRVLAPGDRSVQVHACHGQARQVDVLREVLLGLLADDPTLEPRDVLVMCPDIESFAPLVGAGFGLGDVVGADGHPAHRLRVSLADRSLARTNPVLGVATRLLDLAGGRAGAGDVLDLAHSEPVRRRFGFSDDDLQQLTEWVRESGVRWAFDAEHREEFGLADYVSGTWRFGLDRLLAGVAMSEDAGAWLDRTLPLDDVGSGQVELAGRLAELVARLQRVTDDLVGVHPLEHWLDVLASGLGDLTAVAGDEAWQSGQALRELARVREDAAGLAATELRLPDVRALLEDRLAGRPTRASFRTGTLTVCTMVPMRSVPHRVVCLLGLDDGVFPRAGAVDGDDVLARDPVTGERDARSEDRQLLLDAVLAATETLVVTYAGADEYSGQARPPAVPLGELLDALDLTASVPATTGAPARRVSDVVRVRHPLQPFDARNLTPGALVPDAGFTFDPAALAGARAAAGPRRAPVPFVPGVLPPRGADDDVSLEELATFLKHPVRDFVRQRLDVALPLDEETVDDGLPVEIDQLAQWGVGDRVVRDLLAGLDPARATEREWRRGVLPPGRLGWRLLRQVVERAAPLAAEGLAQRRGHEARAVDVDVDLGRGRRLRGTVAEVFGDRLVPVSYSRLGATHRLQSWVQLLALSASDPDRNWTAHTLGRPSNGRSREAVGRSLLGPVDHTALTHLRDLVALLDQGRREPLPLPVKSSFRYATQRRTRAPQDQALDKVSWDWDDDRFPGECSDPAHVRVWGPGAPVPGLDQAPREGEEHDGETTRFGALALRLWSPLLDSEQGAW